MRRFLTFIGAVVIVAIIVITIFYFNGAFFCEKILSSKLKTPITLQKVEFNYPNIIIENIKLFNPRNFTTNNALEIGVTDVESPYGNYFKDVVNINRLEMSNVTVTIESTKTTTNWDILLKKIKDDSNNTKKNDRYAIIRKFVIKNLTIRIFAQNGKLISEKKIPRLSFKTIKTNDGDISKVIMQAIIYHLIFNLKKLTDLPIQMSKDVLNNFFKEVNVNFGLFTNDDSTDTKFNPLEKLFNKIK